VDRLVGSRDVQEPNGESRCRAPSRPVESERLKPQCCWAGGFSERDKLGGRATEDRTRVRRAPARTIADRAATAPWLRHSRARASGRCLGIVRRLFQAYTCPLSWRINRLLALRGNLRLYALGLSRRSDRADNRRDLDRRRYLRASVAVAASRRAHPDFLGTHNRSGSDSPQDRIRERGSGSVDKLAVRRRLIGDS